MIIHVVRDRHAWRSRVSFRSGPPDTLKWCARFFPPAAFRYSYLFNISVDVAINRRAQFNDNEFVAKRYRRVIMCG